MKRIVVLISGNGSNLQALIDAWKAGRFDGDITAVVSNRKKAYGLVRAESAGIETVYAPLRPYRLRGDSRETYDRDLAARLNGLQPDLVVLAGWMHIFSAAFLEVLEAPVLNLHPALPGEFPGAGAIEQAWTAFEAGAIQRTGIMVHWVVPEVDAGPVVATAEVPIEPGDTLEALTSKIHLTEHKLLVDAVASVVNSSAAQATE